MATHLDLLLVDTNVDANDFSRDFHCDPSIILRLLPIFGPILPRRSTMIASSSAAHGIVSRVINRELLCHSGMKDAIGQIAQLCVFFMTEFVLLSVWSPTVE
jgi:hypothetical protein